jgi:hypothetical protein
MKKLQLAILILVVIGLFVAADYMVNVPEGIPRPMPSLPSSQSETGTKPPEAVTHPNATKAILEMSGSTQAYSIEKRTRSTELFESFDLSDLSNIVVYKNVLISAEREGQLPIYIYEIHGPVGQGNITYLNTKLAMIDQIGSAAGINETGNYGYSSLFYNDEKNPGTGYLLSHVEDMVFGFKYNKNSAEAFDFIQGMINNYMSSFSNNT